MKTPLSLPLAAGLLALASCDQALPGDEVCRDIGYAIASKYFECTGDADAANERYERLADGYTCKIKELPSEEQLSGDAISDPPRDSVADPYQCSAAILRLSCDQVARIGDDFDQWLSASGACGLAYDPIGTSGSGGQGGAAGEAGAGGAGGEAGAAGEAGAGGATMEVNLSVQGSINGQSFLVQCQHSPNQFLTFSCMDSTFTGFFFTIKEQKPGYTEGFVAFDALYRLEPIENNQFQPGLAATDSISQLSCTTGVSAGPDASKNVSITLDALVAREGPVPFSMTLKGFATNVPCGDACP